MKKKILRNIAIVSAIFIVTFSTMLITNYFRVRGATPLQTEVMETLKEINDHNANNPTLQEQIRQLDFLARKAYFVRIEQLLVGVYILLGMLALFIICTRLYFAKDKDIPDKEIDPIDEWAIKTKARKYVTYIATGIATVAILFVLLSSPYLKRTKQVDNNIISQIDIEDKSGPDNATDNNEDSNATEESPINNALEVSETTNTTDVNAENNTTADVKSQTVTTTTTAVATTPQVAASQSTHNAFRGNNGNGISSAKELPVAWDLKNGGNIAWKQDIPRQGYNSPVVSGNKVFFTGADAEARELYCYDLTTGKLLWSLTATNIPGSPAKMPETTDDTGLASPTVATDGSRVCAIFATGDIVCADMNGKQLWARNLGVPEMNYGYTSSLLIFKNLVIVQYDQQKTAKALALDISTGAEKWSKSRTDKYGTWSSPVIATINNVPQLILMGNPGVTAYNPNNGEQLWRVQCMSGEVAASVCSANGIVFAASEHAKMVAINGIDGSVLWENNDILPEVASPVATKDNLYVATVYGVVASFDTQTGKVRKEHELDGSSFYSSPMIADGKVYLFDFAGKMFIFSADDEFNLLTSFDTGEPTFATPAFTDGKIVIRTEKSIYCVVNK